MNFRQQKKCYNWNHEDPPLCISDLSVPIFGEEDDEEPDLESLTGCGKVQGSHAHNLWGAEWDFKEIFFDPELTDRPSKAEWNPVGFLDQIPSSDPPDLEERVDWWNSTESIPFLQQCPKDQAKEICEKKAIGLCEIAFDKGFYKFELYQKITNTTSVILAVVVMLFSITYAVYSEMTHRDRVRTRLKKQMEDSLSFKQNSAKIAPEGSDMAARDSRSQEKDEKFFKMLTTESGAKQVGTIRWWDINFMEQEMEDNYRKVSWSGDLCLPFAPALSEFALTLTLTLTYLPPLLFLSPLLLLCPSLCRPADAQPRKAQGDSLHDRRWDYSCVRVPVLHHQLARDHKLDSAHHAISVLLTCHPPDLQEQLHQS